MLQYPYEAVTIDHRWRQLQRDVLTSMDSSFAAVFQAGLDTVIGLPLPDDQTLKEWPSGLRQAYDKKQILGGPKCCMVGLQFTGKAYLCIRGSSGKNWDSFDGLVKRFDCVGGLDSICGQFVTKWYMATRENHQSVNSTKSKRHLS